MKKKNCWEVLKCGRQPGGSKVEELGVCPAATLAVADGFCGGTNGGRACMFISGTLCTGKIQGTHKEKEKHCMECEFYKQLWNEEGAKASIFEFNDYVSSKK